MMTDMEMPGISRDDLAETVGGVVTLPTDGGAEHLKGLACDSRKIEGGEAFFALSGTEQDGNDFVEAAVKAGAGAIVSEQPSPGDMEGMPTWIQVKSGREAMGLAADRYYDSPSAHFPVVGVTGTNGKSTTVFMLHYLMAAAWHRAGLIGSMYHDLGDEQEAAANTTPESIDVHRLLAEMLGRGCRGAAMEVSSHGLDQKRVGAVHFAAGVFTNLTQDHLDYHRTMDRYFDAKRLLLNQVNESAKGIDSKERVRPTVVINRDDIWGEKLLEEGFSDARVITYGQSARSEFRASQLKSDFNGSSFQLERDGRSFLVRLPLIGRFNTYNALAALAVTHALDMNLREAVRHLADMPQVPGRLESVVEGHVSFRIYVDYAHTPDALENALATLRELQPRRIITVFGCGGDRDKTKRPLMGRVVEEGSDVAIVTSDNPRSEEPSAIIEDICRGMTGDRYAVVEDRAEAIREAVNRARPRDIVLIAGKGHEDYQEIQGKRLSFDDRKIARNMIKARVDADAEKRKEDGW